MLLGREYGVQTQEGVTYGLKQSPRASFDKFSCIISGMGFQKCYYDYLVSILRTFSGIVILVYVDDFLLIRSDVAAIVKAKE